MSKTLVIGANGQIGQKLVKRLVERGHPVRAMVRNTEQERALSALGAEVVTGDLEGDFESTLDDCDALVFTAGSGPKTGLDKTLLVDAWGAAKTINAAVDKGIRRYVMVSSRGAANPDFGPEAIKPYCVAKHMADHYLTTSILDYTILRPGRLLDEPATGRFRTQRPEAKDEQVITREDTADAIVYCLEREHTIHQIYELYQGHEGLEEALGE
ncbi:uncharacterized protein YbjT (DUF2867 family) [Tamilnaduibacter salinus]|uniref:Oxidoreductase n=1 Tax=Tamilnaduibacter salinus TaxID=1484056 RepID=A0A2A2I1A3_9GAMM|nr:SDR family oxidoreductase [Tamilnaduibacter salinus]PAV24915.1 oxidoreductase [Tamilnaduibacter salinus]PVY78081.1 uncharacterized protein YbjT (DUF2867 family) [Tamilnaduibacter salinus]